MARKRLVNSQREAEKWLALEMTVVVITRLVRGFQEGGLVGPSQFVPIFLAYGMLALATTWNEAAEIAAIIGLLLMLAVLLRPWRGLTQGGAVTGALSDAAQAATVEPRYAKPFQAGAGEQG